MIAGLTTGFLATWLLAGLVAGAAFVYAARRSHARRERAYFRNGLLVAAAIYVLLAVLAGDGLWLGAEIVGLAVYGSLAVLGRRFGDHWTATGWLLHPLWDGPLHLSGSGAAVAPAWYVVACVSFDLLVGAAILVRSRPARLDLPLETP